APTRATPNPYGGLLKAVIDCLPSLVVRKQYFDLEKLLAEACPALDNNSIDWEHVTTRLLIGASEVVNGFETVFDSHVKKNPSKLENEGMIPPKNSRARIGTGVSDCRLASPASPRRERCQVCARPRKLDPFTTGTAFTRTIHQCASSLPTQRRCPTNCGSCASIRNSGRTYPERIRT